MHVLEHLGSSNTIRIVGWTTIAVLVVRRRVRHLLGYLALVLIVVLTSDSLALLQGRMRPAGLEVIGSWSGYANPSTPVAVLAVVAIGALYTTVPAGRWRNWGAWVVGAAVAGLRRPAHAPRAFGRWRGARCGDRAGSRSAACHPSHLD
jgi:hypothetical protein